VALYGEVRTDPEGPLSYGLDANSFLDATNGEPDLLLRNNGDGTFAEIASAAGIRESGWSLGCGFQDIDGDGAPDLYVVHAFGTDSCWRNRGDGRSRRSPSPRAGLRCRPRAADFDGDGLPDLYVSKVSSTAGTRLVTDPRMLRAASAVRSCGTSAAASRRSRPRRAWRPGWAWAPRSSTTTTTDGPTCTRRNGFVSGRRRTDL